MSDKAWLVTSGYYSDYSVCAFFSTEEKADAYAAATNAANGTKEGSDYGLRVEEYDLDPDYVERGSKGFEVLVSESGDVVSVDERKDLLRAKCERTERGLWIACFARDIEHATKIATEKRFELLGRGAIGGTSTP